MTRHRTRFQPFWCAALQLIALCLVTTVAAPRGVLAQDPEVAPGLHEYVVWLMPTDQSANVLPLALQDKAKYCAAAQEFARRTYDMTNGRHTIRKVTFVYDETAPVGGYHVRWRRWHDTPNAGSIINMYDEDKGCSAVWGTSGGMVVELPNTCPPGLTCDNVGGRPRCVDAANEFVQRTAAEWGWVLTHEAGHAFYGLRDEYLYPIGQPQDYLHICNNPLTDTSLMANRDRDHWCDSDTHLHERWILGYATSAGSDDVQVTEPSLSGYNVWTDAQGTWMDLQDYVLGEYGSSPAPAFSPAPDLCTFTGALADATPVNDTILVVDKSGSMGFKNSVSPFEPTALETAFDAALAHYNAIPLNTRNVGLLLFDTAITEAVAYAPRTTTKTAGEFSISDGGLTDLCLAISDGAARVRASGATDPRGAVVLLTDGRPTQPPCTDDEAVLTEVVNACLGSPPVEVWPVAFGNADYDLIHQIATVCNTVPLWLEKDAVSAKENTYEIQAGLLRQGYRVRDYQQAHFDRSPTTQDNVRTFEIPPGTAELEVAWTGEPFQWADPDVGIRCRFDQLDFELLDPDGNPKGVDPVAPGDEATYNTRTKRVMNPAAGTWTMRAGAGSNFFCRADHPNYDGYVPELTSLAQYRNASVYADVRLSRSSIAGNQPFTITAVLQTDARSALTDISVKAQIRRDGTSSTVTLRDDGAQGDATAGDGVYTVVFNDCGTPLEPGAYRVVVTVTADAGTAKAVVSPNFDYGLGAGVPEPGAPVSATVTEERAVIVKNCLDPDEADRCAQPQPPASATCKPSVVRPTFPSFTLNPGETVPGLEVCVDGVVLVSGGVRVGLGPGVTASNIQTSYDSVADRTCITFDATAADDAPAGDIQIDVGFGGEVYSPDDAGGSDPAIVVERDRKPAWSVHLGAADPGGLLDAAFDSGPAVAIDYEVPFPNHDALSWDVRLGLSKFDNPGIGDDPKVYDLSGNLKYRWPSTGSPWILVNAGLGLYDLDPGDLEGGYNFGGGVGFRLSPTVRLEATLNRHATFTTSPDVEFNKLMLGLLWDK